MHVTIFSATWFVRELRSARRTSQCLRMPYAALVSAYGVVGTGTGYGYGMRPVYDKRGRCVGTAPLPYPLHARAH